MKKMVISLVIEGCESDIHEIKGQIINVASESLVSCSVNEIPEPKKEIEIPAFMVCNARNCCKTAFMEGVKNKW